MVDLANGDPGHFLLYWAVCMTCGTSESVYRGLEHCSGDSPVVMLTQNHGMWWRELKSAEVALAYLENLEMVG
jgi:hypothetical protein